MTTPYILSLNLSTNNIAYACVATDTQEKPQKLLDLGVHCFVPAVDRKTGLSLNKIRKQAQNMRQRRHQVQKRLNDLRKLLSDNGVLSHQEIHRLRLTNVWQLRTQGLDRLLLPREWAAVLLHLMKHRGIAMPRNSIASKNQHIINEIKNKKSKEIFTQQEKENALTNESFLNNHQLLQSGEYRTVAEIAVKKFAQQKDGFIRNRQGNFQHSFSRLDIEAELTYLFECQKKFGNIYAHENLQNEVHKIFSKQEDSVSCDDIQARIGFCSLENNEYRAAKNSYSYEKFILLQKLSDLQIYDTEENEYFYFSDDELEQIKKAAFRDEIPSQKGNRLSNGVIKYSDIRKILKLENRELFKEIIYIPFDKWKLKNKNKTFNDYLFSQEDKTFFEMPFYAGIRNALWQNHRDEWKKICRQPEIMDKIATVFLYYKNDDDIIKNLPDCLSDSAKQALTVCYFNGVGNLSFKALNKLIVEMEKGKNYGEAYELLYSVQKNKQNKYKFLPKINHHQMRNPVLYQTLCEARFVLNRLIKKFGTPLKVHILTQRDLAKKEQTLEEIQKEQEKTRRKHEKAIDEFRISFPNITPNENDLLKFKLWEEQNKMCLYSGEKIDKKQLLDSKIVDIDHAIPFSRYANNSQNNKILCLVRENRNKGKHTPYEYLKGENWNRFVARIEKCDFSSAKKQLLLWQKIYKNQLLGSLNDGSVVANVLANQIDKSLELNTSAIQTVLTIKQGVADYLLDEWGIACAGDIEQNAVSAAAVACTTEFFQKLISDAHKTDSNPAINDYWDNETGGKITCPLPYQTFKQDLLQKLNQLSLSSHAVAKTHGKVHQDIIYNRSGCLKVAIEEIELSQIEYLKKREPAFYNALSIYIKQRDDNEQKYKKEFADWCKLPFRAKKETPRPRREKMPPLYKPSKNGKQVIVRALKIRQPEIIPTMPIAVHGGVAALEKPIRVDIYNDNNQKQWFVPVFAHQVAQKNRPNLAVIVDKNIPMKDWQKIDERFSFAFTVNRGDLIEIADKKDLMQKIIGVFLSFNPMTRTILLRPLSGDFNNENKDIFGNIEMAVKRKTINHFQAA